MIAASIDALRDTLLGVTVIDPAYAAKQLHAIPDASVVDRAAFVLERVTGKRVLEFGASGPLHDAIVTAALSCLGVDREDGQGVVGVDLDNVSLERLPVPDWPPDLIVCGEVFEHLANPGWFLTRLSAQYPAVPVLITVPNAFAEGGRKFVAKGTENVNRDHVAWYSWKTLTVLLARYGYGVAEMAWYGKAPVPQLGEGLIIVARQSINESEAP